MSLSLRIHGAEPVHQQIEKFLRRQIQSGKLKATHRLPSTRELSRLWRVDGTAVQKAMASLVAQGLIERKPKAGTFVKETTQNTVIGIIFGPSLTDESGNFYRSMFNALRTSIHDREWTCRVYDGLKTADESSNPLTVETRQHLISDMQNYGFKGLIDFELGEDGLGDLDEKISLPRARFSSLPLDGDVKPDWIHFFKESLKCLADCGRKRMVYVRLVRPSDADSSAADLDGMAAAARDLGVASPRVESIVRHQQGASTESEVLQWALNWVRLWWEDGATADSPDGIVFGDPLIVRAVSNAFQQSSIEIPDNLMGVTLGYEGIILDSRIPLVCYEMSSAEIALLLLGILEKRISRQELPPLPVKFHGEIRGVGALASIEEEAGLEKSGSDSTPPAGS
jgi:DNA-binding transcriptional regulator YhcF (GntR family)